MSTPTLQTPRFILRELTRADAADLYPSFSDDAVMRWWSRGPFSSKEELADWLVPESGWEEGRSWAIVETEGGPVIGRLAAMDRGDGISEIAYLVVRGRHGEGVAKEALAALIDHLFRTEKRRRIYADVDPDNAASNRIVEKLGFTLEGRLRQAWTTHIGPRDSLIWGLLADEWQGIPR
ncbi:RimJ/RimL family protein N-acetyltransferase [Altererythrobacter atlanticus]|uniref:Spermidine N(1)-acetyltransferase n=2 Tax=Alphaproteobacteria TaxID=28211 RepID=A0A0F7KKM9_9SPHN|nr:GNAT family protein [Croceibacterium atlanticum]AKH41138.1 Spermidine N(1)-acetyltransferase [Croceibacterium atlanticum]MBB5732654.1 RimJ/RimL family protein N-acetyltransferase [Croceibacterium atlanticum]